MTEQEKRAKVIAELEQVADEANPWKESPPLRCDISYPLLIDALTLLKAREPRVMTLEEVQSCENAMWIELLCGKGFYAFVLDRMKNGILEISTRAAYLRYYSKDYDATWRCWTSRPTEEQREATPWQTR